MQVCADDLISFFRNENERLREALRELLESHSMANVGIAASKRRLEAKKAAHAVLLGDYRAQLSTKR